MEVYIVSFIVLLLVILATVIRFFGGEMLIAGYNTASREERAYMKEKGIGKFVGNYMYALVAIILAGYLLRRAGVPYAEDISWAVFIVVIIVMLIRVRRFAPPWVSLTPKAPQPLADFSDSSSSGDSGCLECSCCWYRVGG